MMLWVRTSPPPPGVAAGRLTTLGGEGGTPIMEDDWTRFQAASGQPSRNWPLSLCTRSPLLFGEGDDAVAEMQSWCPEGDSQPARARGLSRPAKRKPWCMQQKRKNKRTKPTKALIRHKEKPAVSTSSEYAQRGEHWPAQAQQQQRQGRPVIGPRSTQPDSWDKASRSWLHRAPRWPRRASHPPVGAWCRKADLDAWPHTAPLASPPLSLPEGG
jgi:hypothetical protein